jgi:hypothetical protein
MMTDQRTPPYAVFNAKEQCCMSFVENAENGRIHNRGDLRPQTRRERLKTVALEEHTVLLAAPDKPRRIPRSAYRSWRRDASTGEETGDTRVVTSRSLVQTQKETYAELLLLTLRYLIPSIVCPSSRCARYLKCRRSNFCYSDCGQHSAGLGLVNLQTAASRTLPGSLHDPIRDRNGLRHPGRADCFCALTECSRYWADGGLRWAVAQVMAVNQALVHARCTVCRC